MPTATCPLEDHGLGDPPPAENVSPVWYGRASEYQQAVAEQQATGRPLVVYVYTDWCPHCREFNREVLSAGIVDHYLVDSAVKVRINPESGTAEDRLAQSLGADSYPTFMVAAPDRPLRRLSLHERGGWKRPERFVQELEDLMAEWASQEIATAPSKRGDRSHLDWLARSLTQAIAVRPDDPRGYLERARALAAAQKPDAALDDLARVDRASPGQLTTYQTVDELLAPENRWDEVIACWSRMLNLSGSQSAEAHLARANALARRGLDQLALADARQACELGARQGCSATAAP